jgi:1,4-alpha-glucan branching enzyme
MFCHPGKKLLFMGAELGQGREWDHDASLDWHLLGEPLHAGMQALVRDLNAIYRATPALHQIDFEPQGFEWIDLHDRDSSIFSWLRRDRNGGYVICVINLTPVVRQDYRMGIPEAGTYRELINTDALSYGGSGQGNPEDLRSDNIGANGREHSMLLTLPPLATLILGRVAPAATTGE